MMAGVLIRHWAKSRAAENYAGNTIALSEAFENAKSQTTSDQLEAQRSPLPWSHYVRLLCVKNFEARAFYEREALSGGWPVRHPAPIHDAHAWTSRRRRSR